jgi:hypothetical protein
MSLPAKTQRCKDRKERSDEKISSLQLMPLSGNILKIEGDDNSWNYQPAKTQRCKDRKERSDEKISSLQLTPLSGKFIDLDLLVSNSYDRK